MATKTSLVKSVSKAGAPKSAPSAAKVKAGSAAGASLKGATIKSSTAASKREDRKEDKSSAVNASSNGTGQKTMNTTTKTNRGGTTKDRNGQSNNSNGNAVVQSRTDLDIEYFRNLLLTERGRLESERDQLRNRGGEMDGAMPEEADSEEDTADMASAMMDKEFDLSVEDEVEELLLAVDHALQKMDDGTYGICDMSGEPIPRGRLELIPWASLTVECQALSEGE
jgi:DnaK suppressor protein